MRRTSLIGMVAFCIFLLLPISLLATTIHVPADQPTIQAGIDVAVDGDLVLVTQGLYSPSSNGENFPVEFFDRSGISLRAEGQVILDAEGSVYDNLIYIDFSENLYLEGLTLQFSRRKGLYCCDSKEIYVTSCYFVDNAEGALGSAWSTFYALNNELLNTTPRDANGLDGYETNTIAMGNVIHGFHTLAGWNVTAICLSADDEYGYSYLANNIIYDNDCGVWGHDVEMVIINNTINKNLPYNPSEYKGRGIAFGPSEFPLRLLNNIVTNNPNDGVLLYEVTNYEISHNNVWENALMYGTQYDGCGPGEGDISADPLFVGLDNYHLQSGSPCINTGIDADVYTDIDGDVRPQGDGFDIGADEYTDSDSDDWASWEDCDDTNPLVNPGMEEIRGDGIDNDCDGKIDELCFIGTIM